MDSPRRLSMWRRESVGTVSGGDIGPSASHHLHHTYHTPGRFDSQDLQDSPVRTEALKLVRELNKAVAGHVALATLLGGSGDGAYLRDELRRSRRTAQEAAAAAKATLLPALQEGNTNKCGDKERAELERLWYLLLCCLDALEMSMYRCLTLLREFSLTEGSGAGVLIHTGIEVPNHLLRSTNQSVHSQQHEMSKLSLEGVEASQLCKELFELRAQLQEMKAQVELRSLSVADFEDISEGKGPRRTDTLISINGTDGMGNASVGMRTPSCSIPSDDKESIESDASQGTGITNAQRRCICWILGIMVGMFFLAMILGVFIALFS